MTSLIWLIPIALVLGSCGLGAFIWALRKGQFDDPAGDGARILDSDDTPLG